MARVFGVEMLHMAGADYLPEDYELYGREIVSYVQQAQTKAQRTFGARKMRWINGRPCTSQFKGVCLESQTKKWRAQIVLDGKTRRLGRFSNEIAAAQAYDEAARELFGEYAYLNFPDGVDVWLERREARRDERASAA